jgi:hypothetical protein
LLGIRKNKNVSFDQGLSIREHATHFGPAVRNVCVTSILIFLIFDKFPLFLRFVGIKCFVVLFVILSNVRITSHRHVLHNSLISDQVETFTILFSLVAYGLESCGALRLETFVPP